MATRPSKTDTENAAKIRKMFAQRLYRMRQTRGLSREELGAIIFGKASRSNTHQIGEWERAIRLPNAARLAGISKACEISTDWLLGLVE